MAQQLPFELHVTSALGIPDIGNNYIQYRAPIVIKLEAGTNAIVHTGVTISNCQPHGSIRVSLCDKYRDLIQITQNEFNPYHNQALSVCLYNPTDQYIRINMDEKAFRYEWISSNEPLTKDTQVQTETDVETDVELVSESDSRTEKDVIIMVDAQVQTDPIVVESVPAPVVEPVSSDMSTKSVAEVTTIDGDENSESIDQMNGDENSELIVIQEPTPAVVSIDHNDTPITVEPIAVAAPAPKRIRRIIKKKVM